MDHKLEKALEEMVKGSADRVYVQHLETGKNASINEDSLFPTQYRKGADPCGIVFKIETGGTLGFQPMTYRDSIRYGGSGLITVLQRQLCHGGKHTGGFDDGLQR